MNCTRCGHSITLHGRRGHGACRHGWANPLEVAVKTARFAVAGGLSQEKTREAIRAAFDTPIEKCLCKRFRKTALKEKGF